jgi:hypothetical protein
MPKPKLKHLRHPLRTLRVAMRLVAARWEMHRIARKGDRSFAGDPRYHLQNVSDGFAERVQPPSDDTALLERICAAYIAATAKEDSISGTYQATAWWDEVRKRSLGPVMQALQTRDIATLCTMYGNFFREPCAAGLVSVPYGMTPIYFGNAMNDIHRRVYLSDALHRLDCWKAGTGNCFTVRDLAVPPIGNPYGVMIDGTLVGARAEFQHYCAYRLASLLKKMEADSVAEIGGGFGGMAYYLLRDRPGVRYLNFDLPESIALASYYLMKLFPDLNFLLYGEAPITDETIARADVVLMPLTEMQRMTAGVADITFSSHAMSDVAPAAAVSYLKTITRMTRHYFLFLGTDTPDKSLPGIISTAAASFRLEERRDSLWHNHKLRNANEVECLYSIDHARKTEPAIHEEPAHVGR